jgi:hypothetical protein
MSILFIYVTNVIDLKNQHIFFLNLSRITRLLGHNISFAFKEKQRMPPPGLKNNKLLLDLIFHQLYRRLLKSAKNFILFPTQKNI